MPYLLNTWYVAGWSEDVQPGALMSRTLLEQPVLMFRDSGGVPRALLDRCPHRFAPLSMGRLSDDGQSVQCAYHALRFDGHGACVHNPHGDGRIPPAAKVRTYPLVERYGVLWIWMGDAAKADAALIPDFSLIDPEHWHVGKRYLHAKANYVLETDNIMDLSHVEFLHPSTLGTPAVKNALTDIRQEGNTVLEAERCSIRDQLATCCSSAATSAGASIIKSCPTGSSATLQPASPRSERASASNGGEA